MSNGFSMKVPARPARFVCFADVQMDSHPQYGGPDGRLAEQEQVLQRVLEIAREESADAVVFAGDAFEHRSPSPDAILAWERPLVDHRDADGPPVYAIPGNHDLKNQALGCALDAFHLAGLLTLFREPATITVAGVHLAFLPWAPVHRLVAQAGGGDRDSLNEVASEHLHTIAAGLAISDTPAVLVTHFAIAGDEDGFSELVREPVLDPDRLADDYAAVIAGHFERAQLIRAEPPVLYCGSPYPVDFGQGDYEHGVWILDVGESTSARFVPISSRPFVTLDIEEAECWLDLPGPPAADAWRGAVDGAIVRVRYTATEEEARRIDQREIRQALVDAGACKVIVQPTIVRADRARVEGLDETIGEEDALRLWLDSQNVPENVRQGLAELHRAYVEAVA